MKTNIGNHLADIWGELCYGLRWLCGKPSPLKRLITVLVLAVGLGGANIYLVVSSIYNMGKNDARKAFLELQHIESLELPQKNDSINYKLKSKEYEYE
ncbi:MAG: TraL conjugative transposon family protein [Prevotellaceae bacterium]|jgi:hypothetical protein|nr:TraL conjugative transposon family protein [Prevotellaceae bacterium]